MGSGGSRGRGGQPSEAVVQRATDQIDHSLLALIDGRVADAIQMAVDAAIRWPEACKQPEAWSRMGVLLRAFGLHPPAEAELACVAVLMAKLWAMEDAPSTSVEHAWGRALLNGRPQAWMTSQASTLVANYLRDETG